MNEGTFKNSNNILYCYFIVFTVFNFSCALNFCICLFDGTDHLCNKPIKGKAQFQMAWQDEEGALFLLVALFAFCSFKSWSTKVTAMTIAFK